ncbi:hypothetical protein ACIBCR_15585 [Micromonospora echinospora]|uniref:hypothetical protein n=1 Tax=Micromonospora echinospora TaxID=1877 RepID=UPI0037BD1481
MTLTATTQQTTLALNPAYAATMPDGRTSAIAVPAGRWAVKLRQRGPRTVAYVVPLYSTSGQPFDIAAGNDHQAVQHAAIQWADSARTLCMSYKRIIYAGTGTAVGEQTAGRWDSLNRQDRRP